MYKYIFIKLNAFLLKTIFPVSSGILCMSYRDLNKEIVLTFLPQTLNVQKIKSFCLVVHLNPQYVEMGMSLFPLILK